MTTLDSVEAELAAAHEAAELHREVVRHQAEEIARLTLERDRALACEAAARGLLKSLAETILNIEGDRTSRGHEARSEAVIRACVRALSSPPSHTSAPDQEPGEGGPCLWCGKSYTAKAVDIAWDSGKHLVGVAECPACQYPALVKMDAPEVERGKCGECGGDEWHDLGDGWAGCPCGAQFRWATVERGTGREGTK